VQSGVYGVSLLDALFRRSSPSRTRRRRCVRYKVERTGGLLGVGGRTRRRCVKYSDSPAVEERKQEQQRRAIDRKAEAWLRRDTARREREQAKREQQEQRQRTRAQTRLMRQAGRTERAHEREMAELKSQGWTDAEIRQLLDERDMEFNPSRRFRLALDLLTGGGRHARRNPGCAVCLANPSAQEAAERFHGISGPGLTKGRKVVLGEVESIRYRPPAHSRRGGADWVHESGDFGLGPIRSRRRPLLVADPNSGMPQLDMSTSPMRFRPGRGLVG
jgi:hypothetical protein